MNTSTLDTHSDIATNGTNGALANVVGGRRMHATGMRTIDVTAPATGEIMGTLACSTFEDVDAAVKAAAEAQRDWAAVPVKDRVQVLYRLKALVEDQIEEIAGLITRENGKTLSESRAEILRAVECIEYAVSLPQIGAGKVLEVSRGVECRSVNVPLGVVAGITPFNFPFMVPMWMIPLAIGCGNAFVLKPSEQTPFSAMEIARLLNQAGLPDGVFSVVHGDRETVEALCDHPEIQAVGFVGSTRVAKAVYERGARSGKRVRALGGAKNHLIVMPDADPEMTADNVVASVTGCAGQRCMAASVLVAVGDADPILDRIREKMASLRAGREIGAIISRAAYDRIVGYLDRAESNGAVLALDGRGAVAEDAPEGGLYLGASIIDHATPDHEASCDEIFGPTLTVIRCNTLEEALAVENANLYGNAAAIYTSDGGTAQFFADRAGAGMIGINIGVPVPREPFAFGGWNDSTFGGGDITGDSAITFWTKQKKVTTKWAPGSKSNWMS